MKIIYALLTIVSGISLMILIGKMSEQPDIFNVIGTIALVVILGFFADACGFIDLNENK